MADITDVLNGIVATVAASLYPNGTTQPSTTGAATRIYPGWPTQSNLDADLAEGIVHVTAYPLATERAESLINLDAEVQSIATAGTTLLIVGNTITVGGVPKVGDVAVLSVNRVSYPYAVTLSDTTATVAAALAALAGCSAVGSVITAPGSVFVLSAFVSTPAALLLPMRRIIRNVQVTTWANTPALRDATHKAVNASLFNAERLTLSDGTMAGIAYQSSPITDALQKAMLYRRDLIMQASFVETQATTVQTVADLIADISTASTPVTVFTVQ